MRKLREVKARFNQDNCIEKNRGFSLVELIVVIAIMAVVVGAISAFVIVSSNSYNSVSEDVDLQEEAQIVMNQMETMLMNAEAGVSYVYYGQSVTGDEDSAENVESSLFSDDEIDESAVDVSQKALYIYNSEDRYVITWDEEEQTLNYRQENRNYDEVNSKYLSTFDTDDAEDALLAEYIDGFSVSLDTTSKGTAVNVELHFTKGKHTYQTSQNITLRNSIMLNEDAVSIYAAEGTTSVATTYEGIVVTLGGEKFSTSSEDAYDVFLTGESGASIPLSVLISGNGFPSQEYTTTLEGTSNNGTKVESGAVVISGSETASALTLTVASKASASLSCKVTINVKKVTDVSIFLGSGMKEEDFRIKSTHSLGTTNASDIYATVSGTNLASTEMGVKWTAGQNCSISGNTLTISSTASEGDKFSFTATSTADSSVSKTYTGTVKARNSSLMISCDGTVNRGGTIQVTATSDDGTEYDSEDVEWSVDVDNGGSGVSISDAGHLTVSDDADDLAYNTAYTITVTAKLSYASTTKSYEVSVPAVSVGFALSSNNAYSSSLTVPMVNISDGSSYTIYYEIEGIEDAELSFRWNNYGLNGPDITDIFAQTVSIDDSTITFTKKDVYVDYTTYSYSWYNYVYGTPFVNGEEITNSTLTIYNNNT